MKKRTYTFAVTALVMFATACGSSTSSKPAVAPTSSTPGTQVSAAAANKFNAALDMLAGHDKANDWTDAACAQTAQMFLDAAKEQADKTFTEAIFNAGVAYQRCKKDVEAKDYFKKALDKDAKFHRARAQLALYAFEESGQKNADAAIAELRQAAIVDAEFKNVEALVSLGMLYIKRNNKEADSDGASDLARAKKYIQSALAVDDGYMPAFNQLAILYLEAAKQHAGRDTKRRSASGGAREKKVDSQALELAALVCSQAIRKNPKYAPIHNTAGMIQVELGNLNSAVGEFNSARTLDPTFFEAQMNYAAVNLQFRGFGQAEDAYRAALKMRPNDYDAHLGLALALRGGITDSTFDKNVKESSDELARAKQLAPDRPETYYNEGILTQEYKAKSGGANTEPVLREAQKLFGEFIQKAGGGSEFADAVKRSKDRVSEIDQIIDFNKQSEAQRKQAEAEQRTKAAEAEAKGDEAAAEGGDKDKKDPGSDKKDEPAAPKQ